MKNSIFAICACLSQKSKSAKAIYINASEGIVMHSQKMVQFIILWLTVFESDSLKVESDRLKVTGFVKSLLSQYLFESLTINISRMVAQTHINKVIFCNSVMRTFRRIYVNCFNKLSFFANINRKMQEIHFFGQFKDHKSQEGNQANDTISSSTFSDVPVCFIFIFMSSHLGYILVDKIYFWASY